MVKQVVSCGILEFAALCPDYDFGLSCPSGFGFSLYQKLKNTLFTADQKMFAIFKGTTYSREFNIVYKFKERKLALNGFRGATHKM